MCDRCQELETKIERFRRLALAINDPLTIDRFIQLISDTKAEKTKLHALSRRSKAASVGQWLASDRGGLSLKS